MKRLTKGFVMSASMFSAIPMPQIWDDDAFPLVVPFLPVVGLCIGLIWFGLGFLLCALNVHVMLSAALLTFCPLFLCGFIHIDGYMDTSDAVFSRANLEKKRAILKDSHVGAFAVIALLVYILIAFSSMYAFIDRFNTFVPQRYVAFVLLPVLSRAISGFALLTNEPISETGFGATFRKNTKTVHKAALILYACICIVTGFAITALTSQMKTALAISAVCLGGIFATPYVTKQLNGISGDLCGFIITVSELCGLILLGL